MATPQGMADDFRVMVEHANDALMLVAESRIIMCNLAAGRMFGTTGGGNWCFRFHWGEVPVALAAQLRARNIAHGRLITGD